MTSDETRVDQSDAAGGRGAMGDVSPAAPGTDVRRAQARVRAVMSAIWTAGAVTLAVLLLEGGDPDTPGGRAGVMLGVMLVVGAVLAVALLAVNGSLGRHPDRDDARGAADLLTLATAVVAVATVVLVLAFASPVGAPVAALALLGLLLFTLLLGVGLWTRSAAARRGSPGT